MINETLKATNRCVMCGLCLPHCPTYVNTRDEAESPRGRISLIQALNNGHLPASAPLIKHLDRCLTCRACEAVCPAKVPYGELIDGARQILQRVRGWQNRVAMIGAGLLVSHRWIRTGIAWMLSLYQRSGLQKLFRSSLRPPLLGFRRAEALLSPIPQQSIQYDKEASSLDSEKTVALFTGCVAEVLDRDTLVASVHLLEQVGFKPWIPRDQTCCGAIHQHNGQPGKAMNHLRQNLSAFDHPNLKAILSTATGCGAQLSEYTKYKSDDRGSRFCSKHTDICTFLAEHLHQQQLKLAPFAARVAIHTPCSLTHVLKQPQSPFRILSLIPEVELVGLPNNARCCGAAGSYVLAHPEMSDALLEDKLEGVLDLNPSIIVTSNIGCRLHLQTGLRRKNLDIEVMHPVSLLDRQLKSGLSIED